MREPEGYAGDTPLFKRQGVLMSDDAAAKNVKVDVGGDGEKNRKDEPSGKKEKREKKDIPIEKMTKAQLLERVKEVQETALRNYDLYVRSHAEMENMKRRFRKEKEDLAKYANESLVKQLLPVVDNLEKAVSHSETDASGGGLSEGVRLTLKGLRDTLEKAGVEEVKALGEPFDPNFHEAVSEAEDDSVEPRTVVQELQKGYTLNKRLIRPAMVVVSRRSAGSDNRCEDRKFQA